MWHFILLIGTRYDIFPENMKIPIIATKKTLKEQTLTKY